ncbi:hypothetical protein GGS24DRAFT_505574 [Hypoxylon argillaceum]|nr:hypothetical protein GGS24DRAFT_505574 [Hypoxylon argillaceum]
MGLTDGFLGPVLGGVLAFLGAIAAAIIAFMLARRNRARPIVITSWANSPTTIVHTIKASTVARAIYTMATIDSSSITPELWNSILIEVVEHEPLMFAHRIL